MYIRKITLPKKFKKDILKFHKEYNSLLSFEVVLSMKVKFRFFWNSAEEITQDSSHSEKILTDIYKHNKVKKINKKIKSFCIRTEKWGKKYFNDKYWLWNTLWWQNCFLNEKYKFIWE